MSMARPAGTPSTMVTSALPCDSPAVKKRSMRASFYPKYLPALEREPAIGRASAMGRAFAPCRPHAAGGGSVRGRRRRVRVRSLDRRARHADHRQRGRRLRAAAMDRAVHVEARVVASRDERRSWTSVSAVNRRDSRRGARGYPAREATAPGELRIADCGLRILESAGVAALAEMFQPAGGARPQVSSIWGPPGSGKRTLVGELARIARINGFVPIAARLIGSRQSALWRGRSLFVIAETAGDEAWLPLLQTVLADPVPHVLLLVGENERRSVGGVAMPRLSVDALVDAVSPAPPAGRLESVVRRAAERSRGLPGRFARLLWPECGDVVASRRSTPGAGGRSGSPNRRPSTAVAAKRSTAALTRRRYPAQWPAPGELAALRRKMERAREDLARGRQAPGMRQLRQAVGGLARRGAWSDAAGGALALAGSLLRRGRTRDAQSVVAEGRDYASRADAQGTLADLAVLSGEAWIDLERLDEADSVLGAVLAASRALQDPERIAAASLALARASYWRGAFADGAAIISAAPDVPALRVRRVLLESRVALGLGDLNHAMSLRHSRVGRTGRHRRRGRGGDRVCQRARTPCRRRSERRGARSVEDARPRARRARSTTRHSGVAAARRG